METFCTESEAKALLLGYAKEIDKESAIFVAFRDAIPNSYNRVVTFVIKTEEGNEELVDKIVRESAVEDRRFTFSKSDINIQNGNFTIDYLYITAIITPKLIL